MQAAAEHGQRPTAALLEIDNPKKGWTHDDYILQDALYQLDKETCKTCGNPVWFCHTSDNRVEFEVETGTCYGQAAIEEQTKDEAVKLGPGEFYIARAVGIKNEDGSYDPLPSRREALEKI